MLISVVMSFIKATNISIPKQNGYSFYKLQVLVVITQKRMKRLSIAIAVLFVCRGRAAFTLYM